MTKSRIHMSVNLSDVVVLCVETLKHSTCIAGYVRRGIHVLSALMSVYRKKLCLFLRPLGESVDHSQHSGLFDQTPTTLRSFLTSLTSNVWHSRLAVDQHCTPRQGPIGPSQMPLHVGPDHMNVGRD